MNKKYPWIYPWISISTATLVNTFKKLSSCYWKLQIQYRRSIDIVRYAVCIL